MPPRLDPTDDSPPAGDPFALPPPPLDPLDGLDEVADDPDSECDWDSPPLQPLPPLDDIDDLPLGALAELEAPPILAVATSPFISEPAVLPWRLYGTVAGRLVPVVLDPTRARSTWEGGSGSGELEVLLKGQVYRVEPARVAAAEERLILGRDVLADRIWVRSQ